MAEFKKKTTGIFGIKNGIKIPLLMEVPENGTKNWNSQPSIRIYLLGGCFWFVLSSGDKGVLVLYKKIMSDLVASCWNVLIFGRG
jgi:hypothetical protein